MNSIGKNATFINFYVSYISANRDYPLCFRENNFHGYKILSFNRYFIQSQNSLTKDEGFLKLLSDIL